MEPVTVVGAGPGGSELFLTPAARLAVENADLIIGGRQSLALFPGAAGERTELDAALLDRLPELLRIRGDKKVAVIVSGDPGFFSLLPRLRRELGEGEIRVIPGISSMQLAFARLVMPWQEASFVSLHGRGPEALDRHVEADPLVVLTDASTGPAVIARRLLDLDCGRRRLAVCQQLGMEGEEIVDVDLEGALKVTARQPCLVVVSHA